MGGLGVIDQFLETFTRYIDSGFGLLGGDIRYLATTLAAIDLTLAGLFWSWGGDEDIVARLVKKTLFVGVFAYLIGNWNNLALLIGRVVCLISPILASFLVCDKVLCATPERDAPL